MEDGNVDKVFKLVDGKGLFLKQRCINALLESSENFGNLHMYFTCNGKILYPDELNALNGENDICIRGHVRVLGGKGGFGSMLRAIGAQIEKTTNREACRDLSGRRMRDVNNEKAINEWLEKQKAEEEDKARRKKEKLERILNPPRHILNDSTYVSEIKDNAEKVDDALKQGLQKLSSSDAKSSAASSIKRHLTDNAEQHSKKQKMWLEFDSDESLDEDDDKEKASTSAIASPVEQREPGDLVCSLTDKTYPIASNDDSPAPLDRIQKKAENQTDIDEESLRKDYLGNGKQEKQAGSNEEVKQISQNQNAANVERIDLQTVSRAEDLEAYGLERLKCELIRHGLKCGGTLKQRAERLFLLKDTPVENLDKSLFAKASKKAPKS